MLTHFSIRLIADTDADAALMFVRVRSVFHASAALLLIVSRVVLLHCAARRLWFCASAAVPSVTACEAIS
ncbi:hypothetical protein V5799_006901 [Amblyomma americanum]|uniref:Uncharacterized protein n=1 Tax=Amblyomma americanum TaxID=6943 RepID=A0AAQ4DV23_AMBAM